MGRILLQYLLPLLVPFLAYFVYVAIVRGYTPGWLGHAPWPHLANLASETEAACRNSRSASSKNSGP